jgi:hypothetical protein
MKTREPKEEAAKSGVIFFEELLVSLLTTYKYFYANHQKVLPFRRGCL